LANVNAPFGLRPVRYLDGRPYNGAVEPYLATGATGVIRPGDPIVEAGSANTSEVQGWAPGTLPTCTVSLDGDGDPITGVCVSVLPVTRDSTVYRENSTDRIIMVARGPDLVFEVQANAGGTALAATDVGLHANLKAATTATLRSDWTLDTTAGGGVAPANDPSMQLKILGFGKSPRNEIGANAVVEVLINNHTLANVDDGGRSTAS
jgi:hypothetical protein